MKKVFLIFNIFNNTRLSINQAVHQYKCKENHVSMKQSCIEKLVSLNKEMDRRKENVRIFTEKISSISSDSSGLNLDQQISQLYANSLTKTDTYGSIHNNNSLVQNQNPIAKNKSRGWGALSYKYEIPQLDGCCSSLSSEDSYGSDYDENLMFSKSQLDGVQKNL